MILHQNHLQQSNGNNIVLVWGGGGGGGVGGVVFYVLMECRKQPTHPTYNHTNTTTPQKFLNMIKTIGPINSPIIPIILKPVYIAIRVNIGCTPMFLLTNLGSSSCLDIDMIINNTIIAIPRFKSPFIAQIIAHGIITVPDPSIGRASTNPMNNAINKGYCTLNPANCKI